MRRRCRLTGLQSINLDPIALGFIALANNSRRVTACLRLRRFSRHLRDLCPPKAPFGCGWSAVIVVVRTCNCNSWYAQNRRSSYSGSEKVSCTSGSTHIYNFKICQADRSSVWRGAKLPHSVMSLTAMHRYTARSPQTFCEITYKFS
jgi:hypothetical protein